jgi:hypothetical protein
MEFRHTLRGRPSQSVRMPGSHDLVCHGAKSACCPITRSPVGLFHQSKPPWLYRRSSSLIFALRPELPKASNGLLEETPTMTTNPFLPLLCVSPRSFPFFMVPLHHRVNFLSVLSCSIPHSMPRILQSMAYSAVDRTCSAADPSMVPLQGCTGTAAEQLVSIPMGISSFLRLPLAIVGYKLHWHLPPGLR